MSDLPSYLDPLQHAWLQEPALQSLLKTFRVNGAEARVVGGAVRDALLGRPVSEIDLAVNRPPQTVTEILTQAGIRVVPTGVDHGTVTAIIDHKGYELTTLRHDVETDGRHATVTFTDSWKADAARRDFTINAMYVDAEGRVDDYFGGRADLANGIVRFIGDASERIREDVLRILRFFRFTAWFGKAGIDADGLAACRVAVSLLPQLSAERVWKEIAKLLASPSPASVWNAMLDSSLLTKLLPEASNISRLEALQKAEVKYDLRTSHIVRLAALLPSDRSVAVEIAKRLKVSNRDAEKLIVLSSLPEMLLGKLDPIPFRQTIYKHGVANSRDAAMLVAAIEPSSDVTQALAATTNWTGPILPVQGADLMRLGVAAGPKVGAVLAAVENWWMDRDFQPTREECLAEIKNRI